MPDSGKTSTAQSVLPLHQEHTPASEQMTSTPRDAETIKQSAEIIYCPAMATTVSTSQSTLDVCFKIIRA